MSENSDSDLSSDPDAPALKSKKKTKSKAKGNAKMASTAGRKSHDNARIQVKDEDMSEYDEGALAGLDSEQRAAAIRKMRVRRDKRQHEELMKPIRKKEKQLKQALGRKLTNGERNLIRLEHVSSRGG
jgi:hypothetical protein